MEGNDRKKEYTKNRKREKIEGTRKKCRKL